MIGWLKIFSRKRREKPLWVIQTPYSTMYNVSDEILALHTARRCAAPVPYPETIRRMTDEEMRTK